MDLGNDLAGLLGICMDLGTWKAYGERSCVQRVDYAAEQGSMVDDRVLMAGYFSSDLHLSPVKNTCKRAWKPCACLAVRALVFWLGSLCASSLFRMVFTKAE